MIKSFLYLTFISISFLKLTLFFPFSILFAQDTQGLNKKEQKSLYNYSFMIEIIKNFQKLDLLELEKKYPNFENIVEDRESRIQKFTLKEAGHIFPVFIQTKNKEKTDFYITIPTYFVHNPFLTFLRNEFGKITSQHTKETSALIIWEDENTKKIYNSDCTVSCFPVYYAEIFKSKGPGTQTPSLWEKIIKNKL